LPGLTRQSIIFMKMDHRVSALRPAPVMTTSQRLWICE
jgi:hypothetical protein